MSDKPRVEVLPPDKKKFMQVEVVPIEESATTDLLNTNKHSQRGRGREENSMRRRGIFRPIAAAGKGVELPVIGAGNQTFEIANEIGIKEAIVVHTTGSQIIINVRDDVAPGSAEFHALAIEDNATVDFVPDLDLISTLAAGDSAILSALRAEDKIFNSMVEGMGVKDETKDAEPQIDRAGELQKLWQTETGQLWQIGKHRLLCGDSTKREDVARLFGGERARLTWTDPPYGVKYGDKMEEANPIAHRVRQIENDDLPPEELEAFIRSALKNAAEFSDAGAAIYVACPAGTPLPALISSFAGSGFDFRWGLVWLKDQIVLSRADYHFKHENILYGWKPDGAHYFAPDRTQASVFEYPRPKKSEEHPTMKPVALVQHMLRNSSERGDIVYDAFGGSGTTMLASENEGRICRMVELSPNFCAVVLQRMADTFPQLEIKRID